MGSEKEDREHTNREGMVEKRKKTKEETFTGLLQLPRQNRTERVYLVTRQNWRCRHSVCVCEAITQHEPQAKVGPE